MEDTNDDVKRRDFGKYREKSYKNILATASFGAFPCTYTEHGRWLKV